MNKSPEWLLGFVLGLVFTSVLLLLVIRRLGKKNGVSGGRNIYDERQLLGQHAAYKAAFWVLVACMGANELLVSVIGQWAEPGVSMIPEVAVAITVYVVICIRRDAYVALNANYRYMVKLFTLLFAINLLITVVNLFVDGQALVENGLVTFRIGSPVICLMYAVVLPTLILGHRREEAEEE